MVKDQTDILSYLDKDEQMRSVLVGGLPDVKRHLRNKGLDEVVRFRDNGCSIFFKNVKGLNGRMVRRCVGVGDQSIITLFDKTPFPTRPNDVVCPHFMELKWANGCRFNCAWCYLNGTFRFQPRGKAPYLKDPKKIIKHIRAFLDSVKTPTILNSGELSDSLVFEGKEFSLTKDIVPLFRDQDRHKLLILTKSANVRGLLRAEAQNSVIASFSINSVKVAKRWERKAPTPGQRLRAAKKLHDAGYEVRLRIDPMVPVEGWKEEYESILDYIFSLFVPERITLGTLRGLQSTLIHSEDTSWADYLDDNSNWGKKISFDKRAEMYSFIIDILTKKYKYRDFGLCKDTVRMLKHLNVNFHKLKCNCAP